MLAVVKDRPGPGVTIKDIPTPKPQEDEVLVKIRAASVCGTDIGVYDWSTWAQEHIIPPKVLGHEIVGEVVEINSSNTDFKLGDLVSSETHIFCDDCASCKSDKKHVCENMKLFGIGHDGGFAEYATIPVKTAWKNDPSLPVELMVIQEPLGNAIHTVTKAQVKDKVVGIFGLGPIGICAGLVAKAHGAKKIYGVEPSDYRRGLAKKMGFDEVFNEFPGEYRAKADVALEMSGHQTAFDNCLEAVKTGGKVMIFGIAKKELEVDFGKHVIYRELTLKGVFGRKIWDTWEEAGKLIKEGLNISPLITHRLKMSEFEEAVNIIKSGNCGKILLLPD